jgi:hypothetical protein
MMNPFDGLTALVVEDDGLGREDIAEWFRQQGLSAISALETVRGFHLGRISG